MVVFDRHPITVLYGGHEVTMQPGRLAVFWGAMPHLPVRIIPGTEGFGLRLPLSWVLEWNLPQALTRSLLRLDVLTDDSLSDLARMKDWVQLVAPGDAPRRAIVLLEVQARLRRLAMNGIVSSYRSGQRRSYARPVLSAFDRMVEFVAARYTRDIKVEDVAGAGGVNRIHAMRVFRNSAGVTIHKYITQQRVCHAQQMLATTQIGMEEVSQQSGFSSLTRFYSSFKKVVGQSPAQYRRALRVGGTQLRPGRDGRRRKS